MFKFQKKKNRPSTPAEGIVVGGGAAQKSRNPRKMKRITGSEAVKGVHLTKLHSSKLLVITLGLAILAIGLGAFWFIKNNGKEAQGPIAQNICVNGGPGTQALKDAIKYLAPQDSTKLGLSIKNIEGISNYDQDPNCLYPIVIYFINTSNVPEAKASMAKLEKVYDPAQGFDTASLLVTRPVSELKKTIELLELQVQQLRQNFIGVGPKAGEELEQ